MEPTQVRLQVTVVDEHDQRRSTLINLPANDDLEHYSGQCLLDELTHVFPDLRHWANPQCFCVNELDCKVSLLRDRALLDSMMVLRDRESECDDLGKYQVHVYQDYERCMSQTTATGEPISKLIVNLTDSDDEGWMCR